MLIRGGEDHTLSRRQFKKKKKTKGGLSEKEREVSLFYWCLNLGPLELSGLTVPW